MPSKTFLLFSVLSLISLTSHHEKSVVGECGLMVGLLVHCDKASPLAKKNK